MVTTGRRASCRGKRQFIHAASAHLAMQEAIRQGQPICRIYFCTICGNWHLTSQRRRA